MTPQAMGELVDDLERRGYLARQPDPTDRRAKLVTLTSRGQACVRAVLRTIEDRLTELFGDRRLHQLQRALADIIGRDETGTGP